MKKQTVVQTTVRRPDGSTIDLTTLSREKLVALKSIIEKEVQDIKLHLNSLCLERSSIKNDSASFDALTQKISSTSKAHNWRVADVRAIDTAIANINAKNRNNELLRRATVEKVFVDFARKSLPDQVFRAIMDKAKEAVK